MPLMETALENFAIDSEVAVRLGIFLAVFAVMLVWERYLPRRRLSVSRPYRWAGNLGLMAINTLLLRLLFPAAAVGLAYSAQNLQWGLFNRVDLPYWFEVAAALLMLDLGIYFQHRLMHRVPLLWRLHRVHHADLDIDLTTGSRFHSIEILLSILYKWLLILLLGPALFAVLVFEVVLNGMAVFNHANVRLPARVDEVLRVLLVTPDMHRVHHSILMRETNSNYGFNLSVWDRAFKTYIAEPDRGHDGMTIGLAEFRDPRQVDGLPGMLALPFVSRP